MRRVISDTRARVLGAPPLGTLGPVSRCLLGSHPSHGQRGLLALGGARTWRRLSQWGQRMRQPTRFGMWLAPIGSRPLRGPERRCQRAKSGRELRAHCPQTSVRSRRLRWSFSQAPCIRDLVMAPPAERISRPGLTPRPRRPNPEGYPSRSTYLKRSTDVFESRSRVSVAQRHSTSVYGQGQWTPPSISLIPSWLRSYALICTNSEEL